MKSKKEPTKARQWLSIAAWSIAVAAAIIVVAAGATFLWGYYF